jgi:N-acetylglucosaminyldiphosphoundecaprenol N-acetyl-beta-D-mannosaminyltransferase
LANAHTLNIAFENKSYANILKKANLILRDGSGISWAAEKKGVHPKYNFVGTDFIPEFCKITSEKVYRIFLLGARPGIAELAAKSLSAKAPGIKITGCHHGYFSKDKEKHIIDIINNSKSDILLVAFGNPKQEIWIVKNLSHLKVPVCIGVGALFDYLSGNVKRAPRWMIHLGIEWIFRLFIEPKRLWKRYLIGNPKFVYRVYREICS